MSHQSSTFLYTILKKERSYKKTLFLYLFSLFVLFFNLSGRSIENKDYPRHAEIGWETFKRSDFIMLHENGRIYVNKPPLHFINIALSYKFFGVNEFSARFPSALFAFFSILLTFVFSKRFFGENVAFLSFLSLLSSYNFLYFAKRVRIESELLFFLTFSLFSFYVGMTQKNPRNKFIFYSLFWTACGISFLEKWIVAFIPPAFSSLYLFVKRDKMKIYFITSILFFLPLLFWLKKLINHPEFYNFLYFFHTKKLITRRASFFYYFIQLPLKFFPSILAFLFVEAKLPKDGNKKEAFLFLLRFCLFYLTLITILPYKNHRYLLPMFPCLSVISSIFIENFGKSYTKKKLWNIISKFFLLSLSFLIFFSPIYFLICKRDLKCLYLSIILSIISFLFVLFLKDAKRVYIPYICFSLIFLYTDLFITQRNDKVSSAKYVASFLKEKDISKKSFLVYRVCGREREYLNFYLNDFVPCTKVKKRLLDKDIRVILTDSNGKRELDPLKIFLWKKVKGKKALFLGIKKKGSTCCN